MEELPMPKEKGYKALEIDDLISRETFKQLCLKRGFFPALISQALKDCPAALLWHDTSVQLPEADFATYFKLNREYPSYNVKIREGEEQTMLHFDGQLWHDEEGNIYHVTHWTELLPMPSVKPESGEGRCIYEDSCTGICLNPECPMRADTCPIPDDIPGVCRYEDRIEREERISNND